MAGKQDVRHQDHDVEMPGDGAEASTQTADSPLDAMPAPRAKKTPRRAPTRRVKEYDEPVGEHEHGPQSQEQSSEYEPDSPLDAMADAALLMVEVDRIGPGEGQGWHGRAYDYGDGRGPVPVSYGRIGSFPDDQGVVERVQSAAGGGQVRFIRKGKKPVVMILGGSPLPLPSEQVGGSGQFAGYPNGAMPIGGFDRGFPQEAAWNQDRDPFQSPDYDPEVGVDPEEIAQVGITGWFRGGPYNRVLYYVNGVPARPPRGQRPPAALLNPAAAAGAYDPGAYDHGDERAEPSKVERLLEELVKKVDKPAADPMAGMAAMLKAQLDADRLRWDQERAAADRKAAADAAEADRRWRADKEQRDNDFKLMMARLEAEKVSAAARKADDVQIAKINADAQKEVALAASAQAKEIAQAHNAANDKIVAMVTANASKNDPMAMFRSGIELASDLVGGKEPDDAAEKIAKAVERTAPAVVNSVRDSIMVARGYAPPQPGQAQPQQSAPQQQPNSQAPSPQQDERVQMLSLTTYLVSSWQGGVPASVPVLRQGCIAYGLQHKIDDICKQLSNPLASPAIVANEFARGAQALGLQQFVASIPAVNAMANDPSGQAWFAQLQAKIREFNAQRMARARAQVVPPQQIQGQGAQAPAPAQQAPRQQSATQPDIPVSKGPPASPSGPPDVNFPVIMQTSTGPLAAQTTEIDPTRPEILKS